MTRFRWPGSSAAVRRGSRHFSPRNRVRFLVSSAALAVVAVGTIWGGGTAALAASGPFDPGTPTVFIAQGDPTQLFSATSSGGAVSFSPVGAPRGFAYNSIGFSTSDDYIYGVRRDNNHVIRIANDGSITNLAVTVPSVNTAAFDNTGVNFYVLGGSVLTRVNINTLATSTVTLSAAPGVNDFTYASGSFWGLNSDGDMVRVNPTTGAVKVFDTSPMLAGITASGAYGAAWTYGNGNLGFSNNASGEIFQFKVTSPNAAAPTFTLVAHQPGPPNGNNDGTAIPGRPTDLSIVKSATPVVQPGGTIAYTLTVTNNGPGSSTGYVVTDALPVGVTGAASSSPGCSIDTGTLTCNGGALNAGDSDAFTFTADAPAAGTAVVTNTATVSANENDPTAANNSSTATTQIAQLGLVKHAGAPVDANGDGLVDAGDTVQYTFTVTNTGTSALNDITVDDPKVGAASCPNAELAAGAVMTCTADAPYVITDADVAAGAVDNTATAVGTIPGSAQTVPSAPSSTTTPTQTPAPSITVVKTADPISYAASGDVIDYSFMVTNSGNVPLADITVNEAVFSGAGGAPAVSCPPAPASLAPGDSETCTASYPVTQADVDAGQITNTATATGTSPTGAAVTSAPSSATVTATQTPGLTLVKSATPTTIGAAGDRVAYSFVVTNTGNVTLANVTVNEASFSGSAGAPTISCPSGAASLAPGASVTCTASYAATQADVDAGQIINSATATGTPPTGAAITSTPSSATVTADQDAELALVKSATPNSEDDFTVGRLITYTFVATNTGNVTLTNPTITDVGFSGSVPLSALDCPSTPSLAPGAQLTCTATYTITQADVDANVLTNTADATGTAPNGPDVTSPLVEVDIPAPAEPGIALVKSAGPTTVTAAGQTVNYRFRVTNTGNVTLVGPTVNEGAFTGTGTLAEPDCPATASLAPGQSMTCTAEYQVTQADIDAGSITNDAIATGAPPTGAEITSDPSAATVTAAPTAAIALQKSADPTTVTGAGQTITYTFAIQNTGNVTLSGLAVHEGDFSGTGTVSEPDCPSTGPLAPGGTVDCTATYQTTQADVDAGRIVNTATATGVPPVGAPATSDPSTATVTAVASPAITIAKTANPTTYATVGQTITFAFAVENTGNVTLTDPTVNEGAFSGTGTLGELDCPATASLAPGGTLDCTATYRITQADLDAGRLANTATATGTPPTGAAVTSDPSTATVTATLSPAITVTKTADPTTIAEAGDAIVYTFVVENTGNVTLTDPMVNETAFSGTGAVSEPACPTGVSSLAPGETVTCTADYVATQADVDAGRITNAATATGTPPTGAAVTSDPSDATVTVAQDPHLTAVKSASPSDESDFVVGQVITYTVVATNTGNVTLTNPTVTDTDFSGAGPLPPLTCPPTPSLAPGASMTCTTTYALVQADVDAGELSNSATGTGQPPTGPPVPSPPTGITIPAPDAPAISLVKSAMPTTVTSAGQTITYSFRVTNTGNVTLTDLTVGEGDFSGTGALSAPDCSPTVVSLAPGESLTCTATYQATQADVDAGSITNTATVTGIPPTGAAVTSDPSSATVTAAPDAAISLQKSADPTTVSTVGQTITYAFVVHNAGNVTLANPTVDEATFSGTGTLSTVVCPTTAALLPDATMTCVASYAATQADIDAGSIINTATATGTPPTGPAVVSDLATATVTATRSPGISLVKSVDPETVAASGDAVTYSFVVTNTGNVTLTAVSIDDSDFSGTGTPPSIVCPPGADTLAPGASATCTAGYAATQDDIDAGQIVNTATASGTPPTGPAVVSTPSSATVTVPQNPDMRVVKSASPSDQAHFTVGQVVTYSFVATNTGNVTLSDPVIQDTGFSGAGVLSPLDCPPAPSLAPGAQLICTATYTITQADVDAGQVTNSATSTGNPPGGPEITTPPVTVVIPAPDNPAIALVKSASPATVDAVGQTVVYTFRATNTGNLTLTDPTVAEGGFSGTGTLSALDCPPTTTLIPGQSMTCTADYGVTQADLDAGSITNDATASGLPPTGQAVTSDPSVATVAATQSASISLVKTATPDDEADFTVGRTITYTFVITNTGNVTVTDPTVSETSFSGTGTLSPLDCPPASPPLAPGDQLTCAATYTVTQADIDAGSITNTAVATATGPGSGGSLVSNPSTAVVPEPATPSITLVKTADATEVTAVGQPVMYSFTITNVGNVTLTGVHPDEDSFTGTGTLPTATCPAAAASLAPGATIVCTSVYAATRADLDANSELTNTATATAVDPAGDAVASDPSTVALPTVDPPVPPVVLAFTGSSIGMSLWAGAGLLALGGLVLAMRLRNGRRRGRRHA